MKGDFSRFTFDPSKGYTTVRMQQGRVQVDADWNEAMDLIQHQDRAARVDEVGREGASWSLEPGEARDSFLVGDGSTLTVQPGRYEVDGIPVILEGTAKLRLADQPYWEGFTLPTSSGRYAVYLDVWEESVDAITDPSIREVALGGPDTATRTRRVWQVGLLRLGAAGTGPADRVDVGANLDWQKLVAGPTGTLAVRTTTAAVSTGPCDVPEEGGYSGLENQLYRVEIHQGNFVLANGAFDAAAAARRPTFLWSRENGSVVTAWKGKGTAAAGVQPLLVGDTGRDEKLGFHVGDWVELQDEDRALQGTPGVLARVAAVDEGNSTLSVEAATATPPGDAAGVDYDQYGFAPRLRRWDSEGALNISGAYAEIEYGIEARFTLSGTYRTGDYWLIPARALTGEIDWPKTGSTPDALPAFGPKHHISLLAIADHTGSGWSVVKDCRKRFVPLTEQIHLFLLSGGGQGGRPERWLRSPLRVGVSNGQWPVANATVRFTVEHGSAGGGLQEVAKIGDLYDPDTAPTTTATASAITVTTDAAGVAQVWWRLGADDGTEEALRPRVRASLESTPAGYPTTALPLHLESRFEANLAVARDIAVDSSGCEAFAAVETVQEALDALCHVGVLLYVSGDGQCGLPGATMPVPLAVRVGNGVNNVEGALVEFEVAWPGFGGLLLSPGAGAVLSTSGSSPFSRVRLRTGADGLAAVSLQLAASFKHLDQQIRCRRLSADGSPTGQEITFNARILADRGAAYSGECRGLQPAKTVLGALDLLCHNAGLHKVGGEGQLGPAGGVLPIALRARVSNGAWPVKDAFVQFEILNREVFGKPLSVQESGALKGLNMTSWGRGLQRGAEPWWDKVVVRTDADGLAQCQWMLGEAGALEVQRVRATLLDGGALATPLDLLYTATVVNRPLPIYVLGSATDSKGVLWSPGAAMAWTSFHGLRFAGALRDAPAKIVESQWYGAVDVDLEIPEVIRPPTSRSAVSRASWLRLIGRVAPAGRHDLIWRGDIGASPTWPGTALAKVYAGRSSVDVLVRIVFKPTMVPGHLAYGSLDVERRGWLTVRLA